MLLSNIDPFRWPTNCKIAEIRNRMKTGEYEKSENKMRCETICLPRRTAMSTSACHTEINRKLKINKPRYVLCNLDTFTDIYKMYIQFGCLAGWRFLLSHFDMNNRILYLNIYNVRVCGFCINFLLGELLIYSVNNTGMDENENISRRNIVSCI